MGTFLPGGRLFDFYNSAVSPSLGPVRPQLPDVGASGEHVGVDGEEHQLVRMRQLLAYLGDGCDPADVTFVPSYPPSHGTTGPVTVRIGPSGAFIGMFCGNFSQHSGSAPGPVPHITGTKYEDLKLQRAPATPASRGWAGSRSGCTWTARRSRRRPPRPTASYSFALNADTNPAIHPGTYMLTEGTEVRLGAVSGAVAWAVAVADGGSATDDGTTVTVTDKAFGGNDFGNYRPVSIAGAKVEDMDADGSPVGDPGVPGRRITATQGGSVVGSAVTGTDGTYEIDGLRPGTYTVAEDGQTGWTQSYPASGTYTVNLESGQTATNETFANWRPGSHLRPQVRRPRRRWCRDR